MSSNPCWYVGGFALVSSSHSSLRVPLTSFYSQRLSVSLKSILFPSVFLHLLHSHSFSSCRVFCLLIGEVIKIELLLFYPQICIIYFIYESARFTPTFTESKLTFQHYFNRKRRSGSVNFKILVAIAN